MSIPIPFNFVFLILIPFDYIWKKKYSNIHEFYFFDIHRELECKMHGDNKSNDKVRE